MRRGKRIIVWVLMVRVVGVAVLMFELFVRMFMAVPFSEVNPQAESHERSGDHEREGQRIMQQRNRDHSTDKWCK